MFADEVLTFRKKNESKDSFRNKSMFMESLSFGRIGGRESTPNLEILSMQMLTPTSNYDGNYQQPRAKSVGPLFETRNESTESNTSIHNNLDINELSTETFDPTNFNSTDRHLARLNTQLLEAVEHGNAKNVERIIIEGANPNATCRLRLYSACHIAALVGGDSLSILLKYGADKSRSSKLGGNPIHMAAWAGNVAQIAYLLGLPEKIQREIETGFPWKDVEAKIHRLNGHIKSIANTRSEIDTVIVLAKTWKDSVAHKCKDLKLPFIEPAWTPLHVASSCARFECVRLLLAAGAEPNSQDITGQIPLDVVGSAFYQGQEIGLEDFREVIKILLKAGCKFHSRQSNAMKYINSPLHTAIELEYFDIAETILRAGMPIKTLNKAGETPLHVCVRKQLTEVEIFSKYYTDDAKVAFDIRDKEGYTVLHAAVKAKWLPGVYIALENGADITLQAHNGEAAIHAAAEVGNIDILNELLSIAKRNQTLDYRNKRGETALFKAISQGHLECVKIILKEGASIYKSLPRNFNVLHVAAASGHSDILEVLLNHNLINMINEPTYDNEGLGPIHLAVINNHADCVKVLLNKNADSRLKVCKDYKPFNASTPLHIAAVKNHLEIAKIILDHDKDALHEVDDCNWTPLHAASYYGNENVTLLLIRKGADMSLCTKGPNKFKKTCMDLIMNNIFKPTKFMENVLDSYIYSDDTSHVPNLVTINYRILTSNARPTEQMKVVEALLQTGNRFGQRRLVVHPLIESFLYLNWVYMLPFFYTMLGIYSMYILLLNIYVTSFYFYKDSKDIPPVWLKPSKWNMLIYITGTLIFTQEIFYIKFGSKTYFYRLETWIKLTAVTLAMILPTVLSFWPDDEWPRHVTTITLLLSWMEMMFMLSRFPKWGYYVLMFGKVLSKVLKILITFIFLVIGFALSFMIQFHAQAPFNNPWTAFVKTIVMMTSEFDYLDLFEEKQTTHLGKSLVLMRILFLIFLVLASIVLINMMVGVAVNDLHDLEIHGNIRRLEKQVEFLSSLEAVVYNQFLKRHLPRCMRMRRKVIGSITLSAVGHKLLPLYLRDAIFHKAHTRVNKNDDEANVGIYRDNSDKEHKVLEKSMKRLSNGTHNVSQTLDRNEKNNSIDNLVDKDTFRDALSEIKLKIESISTEMEAVNSILRKLDNMTL